MDHPYKNLLSPIKIGNMVLKNRFVSANSLPHFLQGPEMWPSEQVTEHVVSMARNGAAIVTFADWTNKRQRQAFNEDGKRFPMFDIDDPSLQNYLCQLAEQVHFYDSRISVAIMPFTAHKSGYDVSYVPAIDMSKTDGVNIFFTEDDAVRKALSRLGGECQPLSSQDIRDEIEMHVQRIKYYRTMGFDMCTLHFAYRLTLFARFLSPLTNTRTDEYGGSVAKRARFLIEFCRRIKEVCGKDFPIEVQISGQEKDGFTVNDLVETAKLVEGLVDIFQFRDGDANVSHPIGFNSAKHKYVTLPYSEAVKKAGVKIFCEPIGGYQDLTDAEDIIASGKADLIGAARAFMCDPDYFRKALEGRGEDVVPCVRCNKCHVPSLTDTWLSFCTVNPKLGIAHKLDKMVLSPGKSEKVAVVGGGPAGMRAAIFAAERGHKVTLYEKNAYLGGQLHHADFASFKWPLQNYRDYMARQMAKLGVKVLMKTEATPELIIKEGYDVAILALGALPIPCPVPGAEKAFNVLEVFGNENKLGKHVVVVGGSESGVETAMYLCENGHDTTVLTRSPVLAPDTTPIHYREDFTNYYRKMDNFKYVLNVTTTVIGDDYVKYTGKDGVEHKIECDSVVALGGMRPLQEEAMAFYGSAGRIFMIGDCREIGSVRDCTRTAFAAASQI